MLPPKSEKRLHQPLPGHDFARLLNQRQLDEIAVNIELTLISLVQGLALSQLAGTAITPLMHAQVEFWPYILAGFILILFFWMQALTHAISFITWPINLYHSFIYFLIMMIEVLIFNQLTSPLIWFGLFSLLFLVATGLYWVDLHLINQRHDDYVATGKSQMHSEMRREQLLSLRVLIPMGLSYHVSAWLLIFLYPDLFLGRRYHLILVSFQLAIALFVFVRALRYFKTHASDMSLEAKPDLKNVA